METGDLIGCIVTLVVLELTHMVVKCHHQGRRRRSGRTASAGPLFWAGMLSAVSLFSRFGSFFFVLFVLLLNVPSQQLWSLRDGQFT